MGRLRSMKNLPNYITCVRIAATVSMLFIPPLTTVFFVVYTLAGISDVLDGTIARKLKLTSSFGARLDSIADLSFYGVMAIRIFPVLWETMPQEIWIAVAACVIVRIASYLVAAIRFHRFSSLHSNINKLTGAAVFGIPYVIQTVAAVPYCWAACALACVGSIYELMLHIRSHEYSGDQSVAQ